MKEISEKKTRFKINTIVLIGLFLSLIGAISTIYIGLDGLINVSEIYSVLFYTLIFFGFLAFVGVVIGIFYEIVGIVITLFVGFVSFVSAPLLVSGFGILSYLIFLILIGGIISLIGWLRERKGQRIN